MKIILSVLTMITTALFVAGCNSDTAAASSPTGVGHYDRQAVCTNLSRQISFMQDQGYNMTNQGAGQVQMQQLMARYKANGCDK